MTPESVNPLALSIVKSILGAARACQLEVAGTPEATKAGVNDQGGNYAEVASALGAWSRRVEDPAEFADVLEQAIAVTREDRPALIECMVRKAYIWPGRGEPGANPEL